MIYLIIALIALLVFFSIVMLLKPVSMEEDMAKRRMRSIKGEKSSTELIRKYLRRKKNDSDQELKDSTFKTAAERLEKLTAKQKKQLPDAAAERKPLSRNDADITKLLALAQIDISTGTFNLLRIFLGLCVGLLVFLICKKTQLFEPSMTLLLTVMFFLGGTLLPKTILVNSVKKRREQILLTMTDTMELLALTVESGLGYDSAIMKIWESDKSPAMQELVRTMEDINHGMTKFDAYQSLSARCDLEEMTMFANNMSQADLLGVPIIDVLKAQAETLRQSRRRRAETLINKAPVKMLLPMILFIFPAIFIVLLVPGILNILEYLA